MQKKWIKFWYSSLGDPTLASLRPAERWAWFCIIAISSKGEVEGTLDPEMTDKYISNESHLDIKLVAKVMQKCSKKVEILDDNSRKIVSYHKYQSDWSRLKKYDSQHKNIQKTYKKTKNTLHGDIDKEVRSKNKDKDLKEREKKELALQVLTYLNQTKGSSYTIDTWGGSIKRILKKYTVDDCRLVIDHGATFTDKTNINFFAPGTMFRNNRNFEDRLERAKAWKNQANQPKKEIVWSKKVKREEVIG